MSCADPIRPNLRVVHAPLRLLEQPDPDAPLCLELTENTRLFDLNQVSPNLLPIQWGEDPIQSPWVRVQTTDGQKGWVPAAALAPKYAHEKDWFLQKQMEAFWGKNLTQHRNNWVSRVENAQNASDLALVFHESMSLRDSLVDAMNGARHNLPSGIEIDYSWLQAAVPGYLFQKVKRQAHLFANFGFWISRAQKTSQTTDDQYFRFCCQLFPKDSIESFFPAWSIQIDENEGCSLLGKGVHVLLLQKMEDLYLNPQIRTCFETELLYWKDACFQDFMDKNATFWYPSDQILHELAQINEKRWKILDDRDLLALRARIPMFENKMTPAIRVNRRSGL